MVTGGNAVARKIVLVHRVAGNEIGPQPVPLYKNTLESKSMSAAAFQRVWLLTYGFNNNAG